MTTTTNYTHLLPTMLKAFRDRDLIPPPCIFRQPPPLPSTIRIDDITCRDCRYYITLLAVKAMIE